MVKAGMFVNEAVEEIKKRLEKANCDESEFDATELAFACIGVRSVFHSEPLTEKQAQKLEEMTLRRENREPLQYILGEWDFLNFTLKVGKGVLCPRADTEIVAETAANFLRDIPKPKVLELCAGSGCIGLGIKMFCPDAEVTAVEKSEQAIFYLRKNANFALESLGLTAPYLKVVHADLFDFHRTQQRETFDLLVANPPYLREEEMLGLMPEVTHEPKMALVAGEDGLCFYREIAKNYKPLIKNGGFVVFEIGFEQAKDVMQILADESWCDIACLKDYTANDRCIVARNIV